ncbi:pirin family protein [Saezia sanguinis]|uniref:pirin family protein n=1 Tax=Saezia sanguinis TaxID=1965230 RepID=UPI00307204B2
MLELRKANERGVANLSWLYSQHTFSFSNYYDPKQVGFSDLLVINDDRVKAGKGFGTHPHRDMEIFSYVLEGALEHRDSMGNGSVINPGDVQMMSAGTGILHSEMNPQQDQDVHFLQIWIVPDRKGVTPRYQQVHFSDEEKRGKLRLIIAPDAANGALSVYQDIRVYAGLFDGDEQATLNVPENRYVYVHVARGELVLNGQHLKEGDGVRIRNEQQLAFSHGNKAEVLVFDMRPNELPDF